MFKRSECELSIRNSAMVGKRYCGEDTLDSSWCFLSENPAEVLLLVKHMYDVYITGIHIISATH